MASQLQAGVAGGEFTPAPGMILQGHWSTNPSHTVLNPLEMRTIVFRQDQQTCAIITLDAIGLERDVVDRIRKRIRRECGIKPDHVMVAASHTHCGAPTIKVLGMIPSPAYMKRIEDLAVETTKRSVDSLSPVKLGLGCASAYFNVNRRPIPGSTAMTVNDAAILDRRVRVLRIDRARAGATAPPLAVLFHYACHPTTKSGSDGFISADYPGIARTKIERELRCKAALFMPGCFGNVRPRLLSPQGGFASATPEQLDACGQELADAVCNAASATRTVAANELSAAQRGVALKFGAAKSVKELRAMIADDTPLAQALWAPWARQMLQCLKEKSIPAAERSRMQAIKIGPLAIVSIPGEPVQEIGDHIERECRHLTDARDIWPVGYTNDMVGYLCTRRHYEEGGYEPTAFPLFGRPARFEGEEETFVDGAKKLLRDVSRSK